MFFVALYYFFIVVPQRFVKKHRWLPGLPAFALPLALYSSTARPWLGFIDSGELAAAAWTLGVTHPTGYPLWTVLAHTWVRLFPLFEPAFRLSLLSGLLMSFACLGLYCAARRFGVSAVSALAGALTFATLSTVWQTGYEIEVYPLTALLVSLFLWGFADWLETRRRAGLLFFLAGLALTNHLMAGAVVLPALGYIAWKDFRAGLAALPFLLLPLTLYLYLPIRSAQSPPLAWGDTHTLFGFKYHVTGAQYRVWLFQGGFGGFTERLNRTWAVIGSDWSVLVLAPLLGLLFAPKRLRVGALLVSGLVILYVSGYNIPDIESYFIPLYLVMALLAPFFFERLKRAKPAALALPLVLAVLGWGDSCRRADRFPRQFSETYTANLAPDGILFANYWDMVSPQLYRKYVKGELPNLVILDKELFRRTWYVHSIEKLYPDVYDSARPQLEAFLVELEKFEKGEQYSPAAIQRLFIDALTAVLTRSGRPIYVAFGSLGPDEQELLSRLPPMAPFGPVLAPLGQEPPYDLSALDYEGFWSFKRSGKERFNGTVISKGLQAYALYSYNRGETAAGARSDSLVRFLLGQP